MVRHSYEVFFSGPPGTGSETVIAPNRQTALRIAGQRHPDCDLAAFHSALINRAYRQELLADWLTTL
jgi:hypothetical protein